MYKIIFKMISTPVQSALKILLLSVITVTTSFSVNANLIINEILQDPVAASDANGEWFELFNSGLTDIDMNGWTIEDNGSNSHVINNGGSLIILAGDFLVLGRNSNTSLNGGVVIDYQYSSITLGNSADELVLLDTLLNEVDRVEWDNGVMFPDPTGASMALVSTSVDNNLGSHWSVATSVFASGDSGTPGACNSDVAQLCNIEVPEPASFVIFALSLIGVGIYRVKNALGK